MADTVSAVPTTVDPAIQQVSTDVAQATPTVVQDIKNKNVAGLVSEGESIYSQVSPLIPTLLQETKVGYKTTEFWLLIAWEAASQSGAIHLPGTWGKLVAGVGALSAYILSRGFAKSGVSNQVPLS